MRNKLGKSYQITLNDLKNKIRQARLRASLTVNTQLLTIYCEIGKTIANQEKSEGWGAGIVENLAKDLKNEFPEMAGLSARNLRYMRDFATAYPEFPILQAPLAKLNNKPAKRSEKKLLQAPLAKTESVDFTNLPLTQLSWYHHITLLEKVKDFETRLFYIQKTIENGWSRNVMVHQIEAALHKRQGKLPNNFSNTIAPEQSELVQQVFKDPYKFDFIYLGKEAKERDVEDALTSNITKFLLELGQWFFFGGKQYKISLGENDYYFDLLFYHTRLKRYIVIDLKIDEFKPEYVGKMNFYLNLADEHLRQAGDESSIGLVLCKTRDGLVAEYALRDTNKSIGIAEYRINERLPENIVGELPSIEEIEQRMEDDLEGNKKGVENKLNHIKELLGDLDDDEIQEGLNPQNTLSVFNKCVIPLKRTTQNMLASEITKWFEKTEIMIFVDVRGFYSDKSVKDYLKEQKHCGEFVIDIKLNGFKKAGVKSFDCWKELRISLRSYKYSVAYSRNMNDQLFEKLYHQFPSKAEINLAVEKIEELLLDEIAQRIEQIKKEKK